MTALVVAMAGMMFPAIARTENDSLANSQTQIIISRIVWDTTLRQRSCQLRKAAVVKSEASKANIVSLLEGLERGHARRGAHTLTFDVKATLHVHVEDVHAQVSGRRHKVHGWRIVLATEKVVFTVVNAPVSNSIE